MAVKAQDCHAMTSYYIKLYKEKYGAAPTVNRTVARWDWAGILEDLSIDESKALLEFYFTTSNKGHPLTNFFYTYDKLIESMKDQEKDSKRRKKLLEESEKRSREWRESGKRGISSN